jgi:formylglycine-generating enzyme required for sulfatase activity
VVAGGYERQQLWTTDGWDWRTRREAVEQFVANWLRKRDTLRRNPHRIVQLIREGLASPAQAAALVRFIDLDERDLTAHARSHFSQPIGEPEFWRQIPSTGWLNPVVGVSWFEANAFCAWKSEQLGARVRLPTEDEWEAACVLRLEAGPLTELNSLESGTRGTCPVGAYEPPGTPAPRDLLGNCFEWTFDYYRAGDHSRRVVKGGSWRQEQWRAHPAYRGRMETTMRADDVGFRYVVGD